MLGKDLNGNVSIQRKESKMSGMAAGALAGVREGQFQEMSGQKLRGCCCPVVVTKEGRTCAQACASVPSCFSEMSCFSA